MTEKPLLIDTHTHVNFRAYKDDGDKVIQRALDKKIWLINIGSQYSTSRRAVDYAQKYQKGVYAAVGLHPIHETKSVEPGPTLQKLRRERLLTIRGLVPGHQEADVPNGVLGVDL